MKKGFTITEILITMGIIGVVAALVLPQMVSKINRNTVGITLARAVELTEKGFGDMLSVARENATNAGIDDPASISRLSVLTDNMFDPNGQGNVFVLDTLMDYVQSYIGLDRIVSNAYQNNPILNNPAIYRFKKINALLMFENNNNFDRVNIPADNPDIVICRIFFDTNGVDAPNAIGEDIFLFGLTDSGHLVPAGSEAYNSNIFEQDIRMFCHTDTIPNNLNGRLSCSARVVQDGWKINYSY